MHDPLQRRVIAVGEGHQRLKGVLHLAFGQNAVGPGSVVTGLGLQHVGLVRQADVEAFVGLVQLALERGFFGTGRGQVVLGPQYREVALGGFQNQILLGRRQFQRGLLVDRLGRLQLEPAIRAEQRLGQGRAPAVAAAGTGDGGLVELGAGALGFGASRQVRQQAGPGLRHHLAASAVVGPRRGQVGIVVHRLTVDADQVGAHWQRQGGCPGASAGSAGNGERQGECAQHRNGP